MRMARRFISRFACGQIMHRHGTIIGKALESLDKGEGTILVLLSLQ